MWPGPSYFPDFFHPNCKEYWNFMMEDLHKKVNFTGMWLDMNEPTNFREGEKAEAIWNDLSNNSKTLSSFYLGLFYFFY